ncbi:MAG: hypothetical protein KFW07_01495 [Mycoplasmataceae bacterium]|nr:hypothetical protein [Mycoplasmataceae bacterium]
MKNFYFFVENFEKIAQNDLNFIRCFYLPIIGPNSFVLYDYLSNLEQKDSAYKPGVNIEELSKVLSMSIEDISLGKKNLEAIGLIRTFAKNDNKNGLITILKPLNLDKFLINDLLRSNLIKRIGDIMFEKLIFEHKPRPVSKNDYIETSAKYFDMFDYSFKENDKEYVTADLKLPTFDNCEDAIKGLTPIQFIEFIDKGSITVGQREYVNFARNIGLCDQSINTILNYSFECNGRVVVNFVKKITNDLYDRKITTLKEISNSLNDSIISRKRKNVSEELDWGHFDSKVVYSETKEVSLNDLLNDLKDLM